MSDNPKTPRWRRFALCRTEKEALAEVRALAAEGKTIGRRRIVSMQELEKAGYVERVTRNGMIVDWRLKPDDGDTPIDSEAHARIRQDRERVKP